MSTNFFQAVLFGEMHGDYIATNYELFSTDAKLGTVSDGLTIVLGKLYRQGFQDGEIAWVSTGDEYEF
jgi:hypothetical protein